MTEEDTKTLEDEEMIRLIDELPIPENRLETLIGLQKYLNHPYFGNLLWCSFGCFAALLQEILISFSNLDKIASDTDNHFTRLSCVLAILKSLASCKDIQILFVDCNMIFLMFPMLNLNNREPNFEFIRISILGVICNLIHCGNKEIVGYLLTNEIFSAILSIMRSENTLTKTLSTYAFLSIISSDEGLNYLVENSTIYEPAAIALGKMVYLINKNPSDQYLKLVKHIIRCYSRISEHPEKGPSLLYSVLPNELLNISFIQLLGDDEESKKNLTDLLKLAYRRSRKDSNGETKNRSFNYY